MDIQPHEPSGAPPQQAPGTAQPTQQPQQPPQPPPVPSAPPSPNYPTQQPTQQPLKPIPNEGAAREPEITLSFGEYRRMADQVRELETFQASERTRLEAAEQSRLKALAEKDGAEAALRLAKEQADTKIATLERQILGDHMNAVLTSALSQYRFAGETDADRAEVAANVRALIALKMEAVRDAAGNVVVRDRATMRPADQVIRELMQTPGLRVNLAPEHRPGVAVVGGPVQTPAPTQATPSPFGNVPYEQLPPAMQLAALHLQAVKQQQPSAAFGLVPSGPSGSTGYGFGH